MELLWAAFLTYCTMTTDPAKLARIDSLKQHYERELREPKFGSGYLRTVAGRLAAEMVTARRCKNTPYLAKRFPTEAACREWIATGMPNGLNVGNARCRKAPRNR